MRGLIETRLLVSGEDIEENESESMKSREVPIDEREAGCGMKVWKKWNDCEDRA